MEERQVGQTHENIMDDELHSPGLLCSTRLQKPLQPKAYEGEAEGTGKGVRLCYYLYYYGRLLCIIKQGSSDEGRYLQVISYPSMQSIGLGYYGENGSAFTFCQFALSLILCQCSHRLFLSVQVYDMLQCNRLHVLKYFLPLPLMILLHRHH